MSNGQRGRGIKKLTSNGGGGYKKLASNG